MENKIMKNNKAFLFVITAYFILLGTFHFLRLAFGWEIRISGERFDHSVINLVSAICILFSALVIYWIYRLKKENQKRVKVVSQNNETVEEESRKL